MNVTRKLHILALLLALTTAAQSQGVQMELGSNEERRNHKLELTPSIVRPAGSTEATTSELSRVYRLGIGDVVDIRLLNATHRESALYTVGPGGLLEYPLAGEPFDITGLTTDEVSRKISDRIKLYDDPKVNVTVREYASHDVFVTGLVNVPGPVILRREAVPLYVILAESRPLIVAGTATIMERNGKSHTILLADNSAVGELVFPGDVIVISASRRKAAEYFYIGGQILSGGQKDFRKGLTLTQAILASGGIRADCNGTARILREVKDGRLVTNKYQLRKIESSQIKDPEIQAGDRLEIGAITW